MYKMLNYVNRKWNQSVFLLHDIATRTNINWLVKFSIWMHDRMIWQLSERVQLIGGVTVVEHRLERELELANHQVEYWMNYANDLQSELIDMIPDQEEETDKVAIAAEAMVG